VEQEVFAGLKNIPFLSNLPDEALTKLAEKAKLAKFPRQATIIAEGDESSSLYIIVSGKVRVYSSDEKSKEVTLMLMEAGGYFGELALLSNEPRSASVVTLEKTTCAVISKNDFRIWLRNYPDVAFSLLSVLAEKILHLTDKVRQLALSNVYERTIKVLQDMAVAEGEVKIIRNRPTQQDLANMVGASREMVNKIIQELIKGGYVTVDDKDLIINKKLPASW
jgi:CRP/FNR family transcriptional regulator, cyclic AMP receptor protein